MSTLSRDSVLDVAVNSAELSVSSLLGMVDKVHEILHAVVGSASLVAALGNDLGVVGRTTTVPGKELIEKLASMPLWVS